MGSQVLAIDSIEIIDSVPEGELQTGRQLHDHLSDIRTALDYPSWTVARHKLSSRQELIDVLTGLSRTAAQHESYPLIHFECHGADDHIKLSNGDQVTWSDIGVPLRDLNRTTRNQLVSVWAACEGIYSIGSMVGGIASGTPLRVVIGPGVEVKAGQLGDAMKTFYSTLTSAADVDAAVAAAASVEPSIRLFKAEDAFTHAYIDAVRKSDTQSKRLYVEELVTKAKDNPDLRDRPRLHHDVKTALKQITPEAYFERAKRTFFMLDQFPELEDSLAYLTFDYVQQLARA